MCGRVRRGGILPRKHVETLVKVYVIKKIHQKVRKFSDEPIQNEEKEGMKKQKTKN